MRRPALPLRAQTGARQLALGLFIGLMASASHAQSPAAHAHHAPASASEQASDPQAATAGLQHAPMAVTPGLTSAKADWRAANQTVTEAAQAAMPGMDHSAHGAGQACCLRCRRCAHHSGNAEHAGHAGHATPTSGAAPAHGHAAHGHMHGAMQPAAAPSHSPAVQPHQTKKTGGISPIPQGKVQPPAGHGHAPHRHGGQP